MVINNLNEDNTIDSKGKNTQRSYFEVFQKKNSDLDFFKAVVDLTNDAIVFVNPVTGQIEYTNKSACKFIATDCKNAIHKTCKFVFGEDFWKNVQAYTQDANTGNTERLHFIHTIGNDARNPIYLETTVNTIGGPDKKMIVITLCDITEKVASEKKLKESEHKYRSIVQNAPVGIFQSTIQGKFLELNPILARMFGYNGPAELIDAIDDISTLYKKPGSRQKIIEYLLKNEGFHVFETEYIRKNSTTFIANVHISVKRDKDGNTFLEGLVEDISEKKKQENRVVESEEKYRALFETANDGIFIMNDVFFIDCNKKALQMFGCSKNEIIGKTPFDFSPHFQDDNISSEQKAKMYIQEAKEKGSNSFEWLHQKLDGTNFYTIINLNYVKMSNFSFLQAIVHDIDSRKKAELALKESELKFRNVFEQSNDAMVIFRLSDYKIIQANEIFFAETGYTREEAMNLTPFQIIPKKYLNLFGKRMKILTNGGKVPSIEFESIHKDGSLIPVEINSVFIQYENQPSILSIIRDIRQRKQIENRLMRATIEAEEKERKRLAHDLHDEIGPVISTLNMYISALPDVESEEQKTEFLNKIKLLVQETSTNIRRISNALSPHVLNNFGLVAAIHNAISKLNEFIDIVFLTNCDKLRFPNHIETLVYRVSNELLNNTLKHADANAIKMNLSYSKGKLKFSYSDNGIGFDFEEKIKNSSKGIGLHNIISRIKNLGGRYSFERIDDKGILFTFEMNTSLT